MSWMSAQIPIKNDDAANEIALGKVRADKEREAKAGHDGTWVAHPGLVQIAMDEFNKYMPTPNQIFNKRMPRFQFYKITKTTTIGYLVEISWIKREEAKENQYTHEAV